MTKTKRQLRAEAVERLTKLEGKAASYEDYCKTMVDFPDGCLGQVAVTQIIDLLTDDEPPEGDALDLMRKAADELHAADYVRLTLDASDTSDMFGKLADMVERDYVRREAFEELSHDRLSKLETAFKRIKELESERDEWKAEAEAGQSNLDWAYRGDCRLADVIDAAALDYGVGKLTPWPWTTPIREWFLAGHEDETVYQSEFTNCGHPYREGSAVLDSGVIRPIRVVDSNDGSAPESGVSTESVDANDGSAELDSREKLEADVRKNYAYSTTTLLYPPSANKTTDMLRSLSIDTVVGWLDRQASITMRECRKPNWDYCETCEELDRLTAERDALAHDLAESEKLREQLREKLGIACDYAHDLLRVMDIDGGA